MNGFLVVDKQPGMSSFDVVRRLKRICPFRKIGYIGTLDRNATGILPVALNEGVKLIPYLEDGVKVYRARILLGVTTDTLDIEGQVLTSIDPQIFDRGVLEEELNRFRGRITQQIPLYSSKKVKRKPLYKWARKGIEMEPQEKEVEIYDIRLLDYVHPHIDIEVVCSKGTYIRTLSADFGTRLGCGGTLFALKRIRHGEFTEGMAVNIEHFKTEQDLVQYIISLEKVISSLREMSVEMSFERFLRHGMPIPIFGNSKGWKQGEVIKLLNTKGILIGIGMADIVSKTVKIKRLINN
jgi:tRNA pseudouridine55 synthase